MPEMPEVEIIRQDLERHIKGGTLSRVKPGKVGLRYPFPEGLASYLDGAVIEDVGRRGKYLLVSLDNGRTWVIHLGMTGHFKVIRDGRTHQAPEDKHVRFECVVKRKADTYRVEYLDQRRFGYMLLIATKDLPDADWYTDLGPEPLSEDFTGAHLVNYARGRRADLKTVLTDQKCVAGIGNAYVCEALWTAKLKPDRAAKTLSPREAGAAAKAIKEVLHKAIKAGERTIGTDGMTGGREGYFDYAYKVYDQAGAPCPRSDGGMIERVTSKGRATFFCPVCQH